MTTRSRPPSPLRQPKLPRRPQVSYTRPAEASAYQDRAAQMPQNPCAADNTGVPVLPCECWLQIGLQNRRIRVSDRSLTNRTDNLSNLARSECRHNPCAPGRYTGSNAHGRADLIGPSGWPKVGWTRPTARHSQNAASKPNQFIGRQVSNVKRCMSDCRRRD